MRSLGTAGGQGQVGVLTKGEGDKVTVVQAIQNVTSAATATYANL